ncbi:hypothetical protein LXL04_000244 [Taraxacum kok-saghyz]
MKDYTCWSRHGEILVDDIIDDSEINDENDYSDHANHDNLADMLHDCEDDVAEKDYENFQKLFDESEKPLYDRCTKFTKLSGSLKLLNIKAKGAWSDTIFTELLEVVHEMLPDGPKQPGNDIDVYLAPLIEDMKMLWNTGIEVYDAYGGHTFQLRAMIFCTISNFPTYGNLSGYSTKEAKACPVEVEDHICEGDWVPGPGEDSLTAVLGREHPGRTRAVGHTVGLRKAMQGFEQRKKKDQVKESMDEMHNKLEGVTGEVAELKTVIDKLKKQLPNDVNPGGSE